MSAPIKINTFVVTRKGGGLEFSAPVAELSAITTDEDELYVYLSEALAKARPEVVAGHALPPDTSLVDVPVTLPAPFGGWPIDVVLPCVVMPQGSVRWVVVVPIQLTVYVPARTDLDTVVAEAVRRQIIASGSSGRDWLECLPSPKTSLTPLAVDVARDGVAGRTARASAALDEEAQELLQGVGRRIAAEPAPALVGLDGALTQLSGLLLGSVRASALLVGPPLAGKSALVRAWVQANPDRQVYALTGAGLIAGMSGRGQWQARLYKLLDAARRLDAVLYFERLEDLFVDRAGGSVDIPSVLRPYLNDQRVRFVAEVSADRVNALEARDVGFFSRLVRVRVEPISPEDSVTALANRVAFDQASGERAGMTPAAMQTLVDLCVRYRPYRALPGKVIAEYEIITDGQVAPRQADGSLPVMGRTEVYASFAQRTGMPAFLLREDRALRLAATGAAFAKDIVGQEDAVAAVAETLCMVKARLQPGRKPLATFLFVGPTGVGKTEVARTLAKFLFGTTDRMVGFDMSEYADAWAAERLIRGTDGREGELTRHVRRTPFCVVLLDEIEKANAAVFDLLLQVCGEGRLTDAAGRTTYFHNTIVILTSNLGARHSQGTLGLTNASATDTAQQYRQAVDRHFRPEFVNRLDQIVAFRPLHREEAAAVVRVAMKRIRTRRGLQRLGITLTVTEPAIEKLASDGYSEVYGGRALRRHLESALVTPLSRAMGRNMGKRITEVIARLAMPEDEHAVDGLAFDFVIEPGRSSIPYQQMRALMVHRRQLRRSLRLDPMLELVETIAQFEAELTKPDTAIDRSAMLQRRLHALKTRWERIEALQTNVESLEELGLLALRDGEPVAPFVEEAEEAMLAFDRLFVDAVFARVPDRDDIYLRLQDLDRDGALMRWLSPLLEVGAKRGWRFEFHVYGAADPDGEWSEDRLVGPPMTPEDGLEAMDLCRADCLLLRVFGPNAGALLSLERGRVHFAEFDASVDIKVLIRGPQAESMWAAPMLTPMNSKVASERRLVRANRVLSAANVRLQPPGQVASQFLQLPAAEYWQTLDKIAAADLRQWLSEDLLIEDRIQIDWLPSKEGG